MAPEANDAAPDEAAEETQSNTNDDSRTASQTEDTESDTDWKALARKWEREAKKNSTGLSKVNAELERLREANQTEAEKALEAARREGAKAAESEWKAKWQTERLRGEALRVMNGRVVDPRLAFPHLDLDGVMNDDGEVDGKALKKAVDDLLTEYPSLAAPEGAGSHHMDLGPKKNAKAPQDMNALLRQMAGRGQ